MIELKMNDIVDILINDEVHKTKVSSISTRETQLEVMKNYTLDFIDEDSDDTFISISSVKHKQ